MSLLSKTASYELGLHTHPVPSDEALPSDKSVFQDENPK